MANVRKRISELTALNSASLDTVIVGVDNGTTYKIELDVLADAVTSRINTLDIRRLNSLESVTASFETKGKNVVSSSAQITALGFVSTSVDISLLNSFTSSQSILNTAFTNGITARLQTSSFNEFSESVNQRILDATNEQSFNGLISGSSQLTSSYDNRYFLNSKSASLATTGSNTFIGNQKITGSVSILIPGGTATGINENPTPNNVFWSYPSQDTNTANVGIGWAAEVVGGGTYTVTNVQVDTPFAPFIAITLSDLSLTLSYRSRINFSKTSKLWEFNSNGTLTGLPDGLISGSSQLTSSYDSRYVLSGSITQTTWDNIANKPAGIVSQSTDLTSLNNFTASISTASLVNRLNAIENVSGSWITESETGSFLTSLNGTISSSAQITELGFISSSTPVPAGTISGSSQLSGTTIQNLSGSFTGSFRGNITGLASQASLVLTQNSNLNQDYSLIFAASGSNGYMQTYTDGVPGVLYNPSTNRLKSAYLQGEIEATNGVISGSSQLTSSFDSRYVLESETGSLQTSITNLNSFTQSFSTSVDSRFDTLEATIISGSPNYTQVLGNRRTNITTTGVSIVSGSITTTGNPVQIMVTGDANPIGGTAWARLQIFRDGNAIGNIIHVENANNLNVPYCLNVIDTPSAGTYTYSMRTTDSIAGTLDFGEVNGPLLTAVELRTNTNLPSTNNTFTGTNRFNGQVTLGGVGGDEGGELRLVTAETNTTLTGGYASVDIYRDRLRIFEGGGTFRGVHVDLSKAPGGVAGELIWKASGMVNAGTFVTLDNIKATVTSGSPYGLSIAAVSTTFSANISAYHAYTGGMAGIATNNVSVTTTPTNSLFGWSFPAEGDGAYYTIVDKTNSRMYRITMMIGASYNNNFISIERLF